jgi:subfamily B ATP-binding cassette protein HlyB/CyaB
MVSTMNSDININLKSIEAFKDISEDNISKLKTNSIFYNYRIGQPICKSDFIPSKVLIILSGEARIIHGALEKTNTISILKADSFIGLASILRAQGCESVSASSEVMVMAIDDYIIIDLYLNDKSFKSWCDTNIQAAEAYVIASKLHQSSTKSDIELQESVQTLLSNMTLSTINNDELFENNEDFVQILGSANVNNNEIGSKLNDNFKISTRGPFPARIFNIPQSIYDHLSNLQNFDTNNEKSVDLTSIQASDGPMMLDPSNEKIGQYIAKKDFKLITADGNLDESLACLQMLANELNLPYRNDSIEKILRDSIKRGKKPNLQLIGGITSMMGLHTSIAKVEAKMGTRLPSPALITWKNSFAIVKETNSNNLELVSPKDGFINIQVEELEKNFPSGFIDLLLVSKTDQTPEAKFGIRWLLPAINRYRGILIQVLLASFVVQLLGLANPLMIQVIIDKVISQRSFDTLQILGVALVVATILGGLISSLRTFLFAETTNRIDTRLGAEVIDHLLRLPLNYFDRRPVGELGSRIAELEKIRNFLTGQALTTLLDAAFSLIYIVVMSIYSWLLTLIALGVVPIQIFITIIGTPLIRRQIREIAKDNAKTQSHLVEVLTGIQTVKAQNVERVSRWKWQELYSKYISRSFEKTITGTSLNETSMVLQQLSQLLVLWVGAALVLDGKLSLGQLIAFRIISGYVTQPLLRLSTIWQNIQELRVSFERLADIVDTPEEASEADKAKIPLPSIKGSVKFEDVSFSFGNTNSNILKKINLEIKAGQFVGVVGQSGSGKSTLMKLLPRLYEPKSGRILIDDYDINKVELYSLRRQIGIVPQEPLLFAGSVSDNISLTEPDAASDDIVRASKIADAHDFIMSLPDGYSSKVGERGAGLSGGQKQRVAIARTLLNNPRLLIMDEATSALDYQTERRVCDGLKSYCKNSTVFFITHRLSTVKNADLIVMLHQGSVVEIGTHEELINLKGRYYALYLQQESQ